MAWLYIPEEKLTKKQKYFKHARLASFQQACLGQFSAIFWVNFTNKCHWTPTLFFNKFKWQQMSPFWGTWFVQLISNRNKSCAPRLLSQQSAVRITVTQPLQLKLLTQQNMSANPQTSFFSILISQIIFVPVLYLVSGGQPGVWEYWLGHLHNRPGRWLN